ncbi:uncharacterized protein ACA1_311340, partial [Acanthamoeba castellanii str. Neff]
MGLSENKSLRFKADLAEAWRTVADKYGNDSLACEELREISEEALPLLVQHLDTDGDDRIAFDDFMAGKHTDTDGEHHGYPLLARAATSQAHTEVIKVLSHQLLQAASHSDDGHITIDDFLNTLRNISIALQDFSLNLPRQLAQPIADAKSLESAEAELTKLNAKLKAEVEALAGNRDEDQRTRSEMEEMEYTIGVQKEALADLEKSLEEKERTLATVQEQNGQLVAALMKAAQEAKDLGDAKSDLDIELSKHQLQLSTA